VDAVLLNTSTGTILHAGSLPLNSAIDTLFVLGQSVDDGWLALADLRVVMDSASRMSKPQFSVWVAHASSGAAYPLPSAEGDHYGNGESTFVSPDGRWLAAVLTDGNSTPSGILMTALADSSTRTVRLNALPRSLFLDLTWASDSTHLAVRVNRSDPSSLLLVDTVAVIDVATGQSRQFGGLAHYTSMSFSPCR
jgi:hypothetical protein